MDRNEWKTWNKVFLRSKKLLPNYSGIYIVAGETDFVLYVGKSKNIKSRWNGHHRHKQLIKRDRKNRRFYIYFNHFSVDELDEKERYYIELLDPSLNNTKITKYIPKTSAPERILIKLLRTINKKTSLFPNIRSLLLGYWYADELDDDYYQVAIAVNINDLEGSIVNSACVKSKNKWFRGALKKNTNWSYRETFCGLPKDEYLSTVILTYVFQNLVIYFVWLGWEILDWAGNNHNELSKINFFGIETYCLNEPRILEKLKLERHNSVKNGKKQLCNSDFIESVLSSMQAATQFNFEILEKQII